MIKPFVKKILRSQGYGPMWDVPTLTDSLRRLALRRPPLSTVIDVGASDGSWTAEAMKCFPSIQYLLVDANPVHRPALERFCVAHPNAQFVLAAAGAAAGEIFFDGTNALGGWASYSPMDGGTVVPVTTIDHEVARLKLAGPYLIKLDTHGFEPSILKGAAATLANTSTLIIECYNFKQATPESLLFHEMIPLLDSLGFRPIDMFDLLRRPHDDALWQMDIIFMRKDRPEFQYLGYD